MKLDLGTTFWLAAHSVVSIHFVPFIYLVSGALLCSAGDGAGVRHVVGDAVSPVFSFQLLCLLCLYFTMDLLGIWFVVSSHELFMNVWLVGCRQDGVLEAVMGNCPLI